MRRKPAYVLLLLLLLFCAAVRACYGWGEHAVVKGENTPYWKPEWYQLLSEEFNQKEIALEIDGVRSDLSAWEKRHLCDAVRMSEEGDFLLSLSFLSEQFTCYAAQQEAQLFLERGTKQAVLTDGFLQQEEQIYVSFDVLKENFGFQWEWKPEEFLIAVSSSETEPALPERYDYRQRGRAPQVKNQGNLGTCWAFASMMALESSLLPERQMSFSEDHMSLRNSFQLSQNDGGDYTMSMAYLLAWQGPVLEEEDPYGDGYSPAGLTPSCHVQEILVLPEKNYEEIKRAVFLYGGVQSSLYTSMAEGQEDTRYYKKETGAYCYRGTERPNHDVVIVGWDDAYPRENFAQMPEEDGAFICANSWGGEFGEDGYFYVSYFDSNIGIHNILYSLVEDVDHYDTIYQTDLCGWVGQLGYGRDNAYFANIYTAKSREEVAAVGFYATGEDTSYEIFTVTDAAGSAQFGRRRLAASGKAEHAGFYTIPLERTICVEEGERFAVIVRITTPGSVHPVAIEYNSPDKDLTANVKDGEGYISFRGTSWERVEENQNCNVCLKVYTKNREE